MLKGYIVRKRLGTPDLESDRTKATIDKTLIAFNLFRHKNSLLFLLIQVKAYYNVN